MTDPPPTDALREMQLFARLGDAQLTALAARTGRRTLRAGQPLFHRGDPGDALYLVLAGRVRIERTTGAGRTVVLARRGPGEHLGELALLDGETRMADAVADGPCDLLVLGREAFRACVQEVPDVALGVMAALAARLRAAADDLEDHQELDVLGRVSQALLGMASAQGSSGDGPVPLGTGLTRQALAEQIGATRESVSRAIASLRRVRAVRSEGRALVILSLAKLRRQCRR